jgi:hypothetical protein
MLHAYVTRNHGRKTVQELMRNADTFLRAASPFLGSKPSVARLRTQAAGVVTSQSRIVPGVPGIQYPARSTV